MAIKDVNLEAYANRFNDYTELRLQQNTNLRITLMNGDVVGNSKSVDSGVSARVYSDGMWGFAARPDLEDDAILQTIDEATKNARFLASHGGTRNASHDLPHCKTQKESDFSTRKERASQQDMVGFLQDLDNHIATTYPDLSSRSVILADLDMEKHLYNSDASEGYSNTTRSLILVKLVCLNEAGQPVELIKPFGGRGQFEDVFTDLDSLIQPVDELYRHLCNKRCAVPPRGGVQDVILDSEMAGILAHEAVGHTTEADIVLGGSVAGDCIGKQVASPLISMVDFAHSYQNQTLPVPVYIDDEGVESKDTVLIEKGILRNFMHNKESAARFHAHADGNARAYQFFDEPLIRMRNTAILPGKDKLDAMIASVEDGYYLMWPSNGQADSTSEFMFGVTLGYEIKNGELGPAINDTTISGVAFDMLKTVSMVSDEMQWGCAGMCGKKQIIPVGMGGPSLKCRLHVGGV